MTTTIHDPTEILAAFAVAVRAAGVPVTQDRTQAFLQAATLADASSERAVYWSGRATLCANPDDLDIYDRVFPAYFTTDSIRPTVPVDRPNPVRQADLSDNGADGAGEGEELAIQAVASRSEVLRHRDIAELSNAERTELARMFGSLRVRVPMRRSVRRRRSRRGEVDARGTMRAQLQRGGEPADLHYRRRSTRARRIVLLIDVSGSMAPYADSLLRLAHVVVSSNRSRTEVFTVGTRLTRITRAMRARDAETAVGLAGQAVPDWSGGTRLGDAIQAFLDRWGRRGIARGAVVVVLSDGWERGDCSLLGEQMESLSRLAHRVVWVNPHKGKGGYAPVQGGMVAALPHVDEFVAGHTLATFQAVLEVIADA